MKWHGPLSVLGLGLILLAGCSEGRETPTPEASPPTTRPNVYGNEVDGVYATWPTGWQRVEEPLDRGRVSNNVELFVLTTFEGAAPGECAPDPDQAMAQMEQNDALFMLRTSDGPSSGRIPRPEYLLPSAGPISSGGCYPEGVEAWRLLFENHGRPYEALVAARAPLSAERRAEIEGIWANLQLSPIETGLEDAEIGKPYWHSLYTHCGIRETKFDGRDWIADPPITDGQGNPPREWSKPEDGGRIVLEDETTAVYTSRDGERTATFRPRSDEDPRSESCQ